MQRSWSGEKKQEARLKTIIEPAKKLFGECLPDEKQYWTMCGQCGTNGKLNINSEFDQMIKIKLIQSHQFFGVEKDIETHRHNEGLPGTWINDDFFLALRKYSSDINFNPGIVNVDTIFLPKKGTVLFSDIFCLLSELSISKILLVGNFVLRSYNHRNMKNGDDIIYELNKKPNFLKYYQKYWEPFDYKYWEYNGADESSTSIMGSIIFIKKITYD